MKSNVLQKKPTVDRTPLFSLDRPLREADWEQYDRELSVLQGNILKSHGREAALYAFLTFHRGKRDEARKFIREFAKRVTSAKEQKIQIEQFKLRDRLPYDPKLFTGIYLTAAGYRFLDLEVDRFSEAFRDGLKKAGSRLDDPAPGEWEDKFQGELHALVFLAHDYISTLVKQLIELRERTEGLASVSSEFGITMRNPNDNAIEHFGYADGASQPIFFEEDLQKGKAWDSAAGPKLVLVADPHGKSDAECGTYVVFRKLEQNVKGFKQEERSVAERLKWNEKKRELLGAMIVGRFENGVPVVLTDDENAKVDKNDFNYERDSHGNKCPAFAHIRRANLRQAGEERARRIARRGITYGDPTPPGEDEKTWPERGVGLLFHCCQANLRDQFEFIQCRINDCAFPPGQDPLIGQSKGIDISVPAGWNQADRVKCEFSRFVHLRGGEYFFAPSISFLKNL
jgi:Dyp-type peroxidase family